MNNDTLRFVDEAMENELTRLIGRIGTSPRAIARIGNVLEHVYMRHTFSNGESIRAVLDIFVPRMLRELKDGHFHDPEEFDAQVMQEVFEFAVHYYTIRDYVFITYECPERISWTMSNDTISICVKDNTFFRQLVLERQEFALNSNAEWTGVLPQEEKIRLLKGKGRPTTTDPEIEIVYESARNEAKFKIMHYFSCVPENSEALFGNIEYNDFVIIYRELLTISLYERTWASANDSSGVITYRNDELSMALSTNTMIPMNKCKDILIFISRASHGTFIYFENDNTFMLFPFSFSLRDGICAALRDYATNDPDSFSEQFSKSIGDHLVSEVAGYFSNFSNFRVLMEIDLSKYDASLPDIDLLVISYEPSLGFHLYVCELKNNIPATWAKEYLKSSGRRGYIAKAVSQISLIKEFLNTERGNRLLIEKIISEFNTLDTEKLFPDGLAILVEYLVITSQNYGWYINAPGTIIISNDMFRHIVNNSDGDVNYIQFALGQLNDQIDECYQRAESKFTLTGMTIKYDACTITASLELEKNTYLSEGKLEEIEKHSLETGYTWVGHLASKRSPEVESSPSSDASGPILPV